MKKRRSGTNRRTVRKLTFLIEIDEIKALHLRNGIFAFYRQGELIHAFEPFNVKAPDALSKRSYHFDQHDILLMNERFPEQIPLYDEAMTFTLLGRPGRLWFIPIDRFQSPVFRP